MTARAAWTTTAVVATLAGFALVAVGAHGDPPNTGMADPIALMTAFDRFAAGGDDGTVQVLSLSNLRGISSEPLNAGGRVSVESVPGRKTAFTLHLPATDLKESETSAIGGYEQTNTAH